MKVYKRYMRNLKTQEEITLPYLKRTVESLETFLTAWANGYKVREEYFETDPLYLIRTLYLPVFEIKGHNHIPKHLTPLLYKLATLMQCRVIYASVISTDASDIPQNTVKIVGPEENVQLCHHILQRTVIDFIRAKEVLVQHYKKKNKHLFGKQKNATAKAMDMIKELILMMSMEIEYFTAYKAEFLYHRYALKKAETKINKIFRVEGNVSANKGFSKNKILTQ